MNIDVILDRLKSLKGIQRKQEVAALLKISPSDYSNRYKRGTLLPKVVDFGICENIDLNWLIVGEKSTPEEVTMVDSLLDKARWVLECNHEEITPALKQSIVAFHKAVLRDPPQAKREDDNPFPVKEGTAG